MFFKQFHLPGLGHASYLVGSEQTGEALVFDPQRRVDEYFDTARAQGMRVRWALDSHGHNDYLSGLIEVTERGDVELLGSGHGDLGYGHRPLRDGERWQMGEVGFEVLHTPGHTPEHLSLLVYDGEASDEEPALLLSGGALLVGDLARPDLLGGREEAQQAAADFCRTLQEKILALPDHVEVFPTHVAGSLCGGSIGSRLSTTVGFERRTNQILSKVSSSGEFVEQCLKLDDLPAVPPYWRRMRKQNLAGVRPLGVLREPAALPPAEFAAKMADGCVVLDCRPAEAFAGSHVPGALNVGLGSSFATWAGTVLPDGTGILLVLDDPADLWTATWDLLRIGYDAPAGWLAGGMMAWRTEARALEGVPTMTVHELRPMVERGELRVLDVRQPGEWSAGHIPDATFVTGAELPSRLDAVPADGPLAVVCGSGYRSSVAVSLLRRSGREDVINVLGGMSAWNAADYPTSKD